MLEEFTGITFMTIFKKLFLSAAVISTMGLNACATDNTAPYSEINDPWEPYNRAVFSFNRGVDYVLLDPLTEGYRFIVPDAFRIAISNFLKNIKSPVYLANELLQGDWDGAALVTKRFVFNTFTGFGGILDTASWEGMTYEPEDFGQTMAVLGIKFWAICCFTNIGAINGSRWIWFGRGLRYGPNHMVCMGT